MTGSTPADLAVTFRSLDRRLREALDGGDTERAAAPLAQLRSVVGSAAAELGIHGIDPNQGALGPTGDAIATQIERIPVDDWDDAQLDRLRALGLEAGRLLRSIADLTPDDD
jgi:hypothetical protein